MAFGTHRLRALCGQYVFPARWPLAVPGIFQALKTKVAPGRAPRWYKVTYWNPLLHHLRRAYLGGDVWLSGISFQQLWVTL